MKEVHLFVALRRTKENPNLKEHCIRHIIRDYGKDLAIVKAMCANNEGVYRIYKTVNPRSTEKAWKELQHKLIENPQLADRLESEWKTALLQPKCKADDKLLIDVDSTDLTFALQIISKFDSDFIDSTLTPNGRHLIINRVDTRCLDGIENVEVKRDALVFVDYANTSDWKVYSKHYNKGGNDGS